MAKARKRTPCLCDWYGRLSQYLRENLGATVMLKEKQEALVNFQATFEGVSAEIEITPNCITAGYTTNFEDSVQECTTLNKFDAALKDMFDEHQTFAYSITERVGPTYRYITVSNSAENLANDLQKRKGRNYCLSILHGSDIAYDVLSSFYKEA